MTNTTAAIVNVYGAKNLLDYNDLSSQTIHGVDITVNSDKSISTNGTNDGTLTVLAVDSHLYLPVGIYTFSDGGYSTQFGGYVYMQMSIYSGASVGNTSRGEFTFTVSDPNTRYALELVISVGKTLAGTFYPMIRDARIKDSTYTPYTMTNMELTERVIIVDASIDALTLVAGETANLNISSVVPSGYIPISVSYVSDNNYGLCYSMFTQFLNDSWFLLFQNTTNSSVTLKGHAKISMMKY